MNETYEIIENSSGLYQGYYILEAPVDIPIADWRWNSDELVYPADFSMGPFASEGEAQQYIVDHMEEIK